MIRLLPLYGVGDCYLVCALARAFERTHGLEVVVGAKAAQGVVPEMFGLRWEAADAEIARAETSVELQREWRNVIAPGATLYVHPHFVRSDARLDQLTVKPRVSQADMYRALLHLSPWEPLASPAPAKTIAPVDVLLLTKSNSWPGAPGDFWRALEKRLFAEGRFPTVNDPASMRLGALFALGACALWIIGPQCGAMSALCEMGVAARKTIAVRELGKDCPYLFGLTESMPYGHCSTFAGNDHADVHHVVVPASGWEPAIEEIVGHGGGGAPQV